MSEVGKDSHHHLNHSQHHSPPPEPPQYGTYQAVANYPPPQPVTGFPQPVPPPGASDQAAHYYAHGYQAVPGYAVAEGRQVPVGHLRLPCCGIGIGWFLFIIGFFCVGIPWYVAAFVLLCAEIDHREKPGYIMCTIAAVLATVALILGLTNR